LAQPGRHFFKMLSGFTIGQVHKEFNFQHSNLLGNFRSFDFY
jgi:hypothetical protein